jgi:hypothetical protein
MAPGFGTGLEVNPEERAPGFRAQTPEPRGFEYFFKFLFLPRHQCTTWIPTDMYCHYTETTMKRTAPDHEVINIEEIDSEQQDSQSGRNKRSFVWTKDKPGMMEAICQVVTKSGAICGRSIKKDKSSSTKPFTCQPSMGRPKEIASKIISDGTALPLDPSNQRIIRANFSTGRRIVSWQQSSLKPTTIKGFLCLKDWFKAFDGPS